MSIDRTKKQANKGKDPNNNIVDIGMTPFDEQKVSSENIEGLLGNILKELKIMNLHFSLITDEDIRKQEIE